MMKKLLLHRSITGMMTANHSPVIERTSDAPMMKK